MFYILFSYVHHFLFLLSPQGIISVLNIRVSRQHNSEYIYITSGLSRRENIHENCLKSVCSVCSPRSKHKRGKIFPRVHIEILHQIFMFTTRAFISLFIVTLAFIYLLHLRPRVIRKLLKVLRPRLVVTLWIL